MSRHHRRTGSGKVEMAAPVPAEKVLKYLGWRWAVVYDFGQYVAIADVCLAKGNAENLADKLNAERGEGSKCYKVAPIAGVTDEDALKL